MKVSAYFAASSAALALAGPIEKRAMETEWEIVTVTATVTAGAAQPTKVPGAAFVEKNDAPVVVKPTEVPEPVVEKPDAPIVVKPTQEAKPEPTQEAPAPQPPKGDLSYEEAVVKAHNDPRSYHGAPPLKWDDSLLELATAAATRNSGDHCGLEHTKERNGNGENLAWSAGTNLHGGENAHIRAAEEHIIQQWFVNEVPLYSSWGSEPSWNAAWGHMTQMIWVETERIACATLSCKSGTMAGYATACVYGASGNVAGGYAKNVLPEQSGKSFNKDFNRTPAKKD